ncbi:hypothetical protein QBC47DRAFT_164300 [Echria macrotheca]|uniref:Uncharacterized protein n=1 Tax=Echria macrotheca TaxID=438768 RepID=A0AAJ0F796_9PEZI|nr:hypothetical protein QBC47DRAFT_164300 [Echria macrotheca]
MFIQQVAKHHGVAIQVDDGGASLSIHSFSYRKAKQTRADLDYYFSDHAGELPAYDGAVLVASPVNDLGAAIFVLDKGDASGARPIIDAQAMATMDLPSMASDLTLMIADKVRLQDTLSPAIRGLRFFAGKMRLRVHFGRLLMGEWEKDRNHYSLGDLRSLLGCTGCRGTSSINPCISPNYSLESLRSKLSTVVTFKSPTAALAGDSDVQPVYSVFLHTKTIVIESEIGTARGQGDTIDYYFGPFQAHFRDDRHRGLTILQSCPHRRYDWLLVLHNFLNDGQLGGAMPFTPWDLTNSARFTQTPPGEFPRFSLPGHFVKAHDIEGIFAKRSWTYSVNAYYDVEVSQVFE